MASHGAPGHRTTIGPFTVLLEQKSTQELVTEMRILLNYLGQVTVKPRMEQAKRARTGEAAYRPRTSPTRPPKGIPPGDDQSAVE